jgi:N-succinyldiaminopimelate aminotransferase
MNPLLDRLQPYPFERLKALTAGITPNPDFTPISLGIGEPRHAAPALIEEAIRGAMKGLSGRPRPARRRCARRLRPGSAAATA